MTVTDGEGSGMTQRIITGALLIIMLTALLFLGGWYFAVAAFIAMPTKTASTSNIERQISLFFMGSSEKGEDLHPPPMRC